MSYHETYEFFAIDRCLTRTEMDAMRAISTRATITPARFYNFYDWGGLKGDPREMLRHYFDLFVHTGNGRPDWAMLRFPVDHVDLRRWRRYVAEQRGAHPPARAASVAIEGDAAILTITPAEDAVVRRIVRVASEDEDDHRDDDEFDDEFDDEDDFDSEFFGESVDEASWPVPLALARADLLAGDLRPLYLLWLLSVQCGERRTTAAEPPRPPGIERLTGSLYTFAELLRLNPDLVTVALETPPAGGRTAAELLEAARAYALEREQAEAARAATVRTMRLDALAQRQASEWSEIDQLLDAPKVKPSAYDDVIRRLTTLHELGVDRGAEAPFRVRLRHLLERYASKTALQRRVRKAGLAEVELKHRQDPADR